MSHEIYYTSAPEGLKRGTSGFCTVAASEHIPRPLLERLETLSAYRHHFAMNAEGGAAGDAAGVAGAGPGAGGRNPVSQGHSILSVTGKSYHVLSRICDSGVDHTQRTNAFAHHLVLDTAEMERVAGGPAWMLAQSGVMAEQWDGHTRALTRSKLPQGDRTGASLVCKAWAAATGDAGWGGHLADLFARSPTRPVCLLFAPGQEMLELLAEAIALLPAATRWNVTFNTYFTSMPTSATCLWRCCLAGTPAAQVGVRYGASGLVLDLTDPSRLGAPPAGTYVTAARTGEAVESAPAVVARPTKSLRTGATPVKSSPAEVDDEEEQLEKQRADIFELADPQQQQSPAAEGSPVQDAQTPALSNESIETSIHSDLAAISRAANISAGTSLQIGKGSRRSMRRADDALAEMDADAGRAAQRHRKQVVWLLAGALGLIAVAMGLMWIAYQKSVPRDIDDAPRVTLPQSHDAQPPAQPPAPPLASPTPDKDVPVPPPVVAQTKAAPVAPLPAPEPVAAAPVFPAVITLMTPIDRPNPGNGIGDRTQTWPLRAADVATPGTVTGLHLRLASSRGDANEINAASPDIVYESESPGTLRTLAATRNARPGIALQWKTATGDNARAFTEVAFIAFDRKAPALELQWHSAALLKNPQIVPFIYWVLRNSSVELTGPLPPLPQTGQRIDFQRFDPGTVAIADATIAIPWPVELPRETVVTPPAASDLPAGWEASWYTDWVVKDAALRSAANASQVIKFKKPTAMAGIDAWFLITFRPGLANADSTYARRLAADQADQADAASQLHAIDAKIDQAKAENHGVLLDTPGAHEFLAEQERCTQRLNAYNAAVAAYQELTHFDVAFALPAALPLATLHFKQGGGATDTGKR